MTLPLGAYVSDGVGFNDRAYWAFTQLKASDRAFDQRELGRLVGEAMGREPFSQSSAGRWLKDVEPDLETILALAKVFAPLGITAGWLAFGELSGCPEPPGYIVRRFQPMPQPD